jgi:polyisoprenoid-binding protein YceI
LRRRWPTPTEHRDLSDVARPRPDTYRAIPVAGVYTVDANHTCVEFVSRFLVITKVRGRLRRVSGDITIAEIPERSHVEVELHVASLDTGNALRDRHLRSPDFFDVAQYPTISFRSTDVRRASRGRWSVTGDLSVRAVTHPVSLSVTFDGNSRSPDGNTSLVFSADADLGRGDLGLRWNVALETGNVLVPRKVRIKVAARAFASTTPL